MNRILKKLLVVILLAMAPAYCAFAQSASESYENGMALMKKKNYEAAIKCFKASMVINKSAANVKNCKAQIAKCQKAMSKKSDDVPYTPVVEKRLKLSTSFIPVPAVPEHLSAVTITTEPESKDWKAEIDGDVKWVTMTKGTDGKSIRLEYQPNEQTIVRHASIAVHYGNETKRVHIEQQGIEVELTTEKPNFQFKKKGGQVIIKVGCNSDTTYADNRNWCVDQYPDWCKAEAVSGGVCLTAEPLAKNSPNYKTGRGDVVVLRSQDKEQRIAVTQK